MTTHRHPSWWNATNTAPGIVHVHPVMDGIDHELDDYGDCICGPTVEIIAKDGRPDLHRFTHFALNGRPS